MVAAAPRCRNGPKTPLSSRESQSNTCRSFHSKETFSKQASVRGRAGSGATNSTSRDSFSPSQFFTAYPAPRLCAVRLASR